MTWFLLWIGLAVVVGVAAQQRRNRNGVGWFLLALLISPLIAGLLVLAMRTLVSNAPYRVEGGRIVPSDREFAETERQIQMAAYPQTIKPETESSFWGVLIAVAVFSIVAALVVGSIHF